MTPARVVETLRGALFGSACHTFQPHVYVNERAVCGLRNLREDPVGSSAQEIEAGRKVEVKTVSLPNPLIIESLVIGMRIDLYKYLKSGERVEFEEGYVQST